MVLVRHMIYPLLQMLFVWIFRGISELPNASCSISRQIWSQFLNVLDFTVWCHKASKSCLIFGKHRELTRWWRFGSQSPYILLGQYGWKGMKDALKERRNLFLLNVFKTYFFGTKGFLLLIWQILWTCYTFIQVQIFVILNVPFWYWYQLNFLENHYKKKCHHQDKSNN